MQSLWVDHSCGQKLSLTTGESLSVESGLVSLPGFRSSSLVRGSSFVFSLQIPSLEAQVHLFSIRWLLFLYKQNGIVLLSFEIWKRSLHSRLIQVSSKRARSLGDRVFFTKEAEVGSELLTICPPILEAAALGRVH